MIDVLHTKQNNIKKKIQFALMESVRLHILQKYIARTMRIEKLIKRYFVNGYRQAKGHKRKKTLTLKKYFKKLLK